MWIKGQTLNELVVGVAQYAQEARTLSEQNKVLQTNLDWLRFRTNQLEKERAQLLFQVSGVKIPTPEIQITPERVDYNQLPSFEDVGDDEAARLGVSHNVDGTLRYENPKK